MEKFLVVVCAVKVQTAWEWAEMNLGGGVWQTEVGIKIDKLGLTLLGHPGSRCPRPTLPQCQAE